MKHIWMQIELSEVDTDDLIEELGDRYLNEAEQGDLLALIKNNDSRKIEMFLKVMEKFTILELEKMFAEPINAAVSENQIPLFNQ